MQTNPMQTSQRVLFLRTAARRVFDAAVAAVQPAHVLPRFLPPPPAGRVLIFAGGKAGASAAAAAEAFYSVTHGLDPDRLTGLAITRHGYGVPTKALRVIEAGHPNPDESGLAATGRMLDLAATATSADLALVLISGGASANLVAPAPGVTLAEKRQVARDLMRAGASIQALNTVRKHLSRIKGGRLALHLAGAGAIHTLAMSDVPGDDPAVIGSGPTVPDPSTLAEARAVLLRHGVEATPGVRAALADMSNETPKPGHQAFTKARCEIVARPTDAVRAAEHAAAALGYRVLNLGSELEGEARAIAGQHARMALAVAERGERTIILSGGELTVTVRGEGQGGPNQEYALALALALRGCPGLAALAADTDGTDGGRGDPSDPAGAFVDETTLDRAHAIGLDGRRALDANDSTGFFRPLDDLLTCGPTLTNANDLRVIVIDP